MQYIEYIWFCVCGMISSTFLPLSGTKLHMPQDGESGGILRSVFIRNSLLSAALGAAVLLLELFARSTQGFNPDMVLNELFTSPIVILETLFLNLTSILETLFVGGVLGLGAYFFISGAKKYPAAQSSMEPIHSVHNDSTQQASNTNSDALLNKEPQTETEPSNETTGSPEETGTYDENINSDCQSLAPDSVPSSPKFSLSYDDIEKGELLGSGGNADVYRANATTESGEVPLAIKEPRMGGVTVDAGTVDQMLNEAETWQQLDGHEHIVSVVDFGSTPLPWIGMEYMDGGDLSERVGELSFEQALWTALAITRGVRYAHKRGVAHLDLKPSNILFRSVEDAWDVPKVADWGLSKHLLEHSRSVEGMSPRYAGPEQLNSGQFGQTDTVTDVYQLGTVFYELFTGEPPFDGETYEVMNKIQSTSPAPPSERADLPEKIDDILLTALATEKNDRYDDVILLRNALREVWDDYK